MENTFENTIRQLNSLIATSSDSAKSYINSANHVSDISVKTVLMKISAERYSYKDALAALIITMGGKTKEPGGAGNVIHRSWSDIRSVFSDGTDKSAITSCISADESILKIYKEAMGADYLTDNARQLIKSQLDGVEGALNELKDAAGMGNQL